MKKFCRMACISYKSMFSHVDPVLYVLMMIVNPILQMTFFTFLVKYAYRTVDIGPWVISNAFMLGMNSAIFMVGTAIRNERNAGTLEYVVGSPAKSLLVFLSRCSLQILDIMLKTILGVLVAYLIFDFKIASGQLMDLAMVLLTGVLSGLSFGMLLGSACLLLREDLVFLNSSEQGLMVLTGAFFPVALMPVALQKISTAIPMTNGIAAARELLKSGGNQVFHSLMIKELFIAAVYFLLGYMLYELCIHLARKHATLDLS